MSESHFQRPGLLEGLFERVITMIGSFSKVRFRTQPLATSVTPGPAAGGGASIIAGTARDSTGFITINTGTAPPTGEVFTIVFRTPGTVGDQPRIIVRGIENAASVNAANNFFQTFNDETTLVVSTGVALPASTQLRFHYFIFWQEL